MTHEVKKRALGFGVGDDEFVGSGRKGVTRWQPLFLAGDWATRKHIEGETRTVDRDSDFATSVLVHPGQRLERATFDRDCWWIGPFDAGVLAQAEALDVAVGRGAIASVGQHRHGEAPLGADRQ